MMISGAIFLNRNIPTKMIYKKYILRMVLSFITWSLFYALMNEDTFQKGFLYSISVHKRAIATGHYHMWFILMIIGIYCCIPIYKKIIEDLYIMKYFMVVSFVVAFLVPWTLQLINDYVACNSEFTAKLIEIVKTNVSKMNLHVVLGYSFYFILGYYLDNIELSKRQRVIIYLVGVAGFVFTILIDLYLSLRTQQACSTYYGNFNVNIVCEAVCIYTMVKYCSFKNTIINGYIGRIAEFAFGAYLIHAFFIERFSAGLKFSTLSFNPIISVPIISCAVFVCSMGISALINQIPLVNKYVV